MAVSGRQGVDLQYSQPVSEHRAARPALLRPGLAPTLVVLVLLPVLLGLGFWQLARAAEKRSLLAAAEARRELPPRPVAELPGLAEPAFARVRLQGRFDMAHSVLLDNRTRDGVAGVELLQPFHDKSSGLWLLVNRGWQAWPNRRVPPSLDAPPRDLLLDAWVYLPPPGGLQLADAPSSGWPRLVSRIDAQALWQAIGQRGVPLELRLEAGEASFDTQWPVVALAPERHVGYAVQWFAMATALLILYLYLGLRRARETTAHESQPAPR